MPTLTSRNTPPSWIQPSLPTPSEKHQLIEKIKLKEDKMKTFNVKPIIQTANREIIDSLLAMNTNNRPVKDTVVKAYMQDIQDGRWFLTNQGIGVDENGVLVDGQHRLLAIKNCGYPSIPLLIVYGLDGKAQEVVDQHTKRSVRDIWRIALNASVAYQAPAVCSVIYRQKNAWATGAISAQRLKDVLDEYYEQIEFVFDNIPNFKFFAAPYLSAFVTVAKQRPDQLDKISDFIKKVFYGENLNKKMPEFHLRNFVITSTKFSGGSTLQQERFEKTIRALTASINGQEMGCLRSAKVS